MLIVNNLIIMMNTCTQGLASVKRIMEIRKTKKDLKRIKKIRESQNVALKKLITKCLTKWMI